MAVSTSLLKIPLEGDGGGGQRDQMVPLIPSTWLSLHSGLTGSWLFNGLASSGGLWAAFL